MSLCLSVVSDFDMNPSLVGAQSITCAQKDVVQALRACPFLFNLEHSEALVSILKINS